tara:strand:+ start:161 stop:436 length:276 start_codon:yes stop_codon:yes gene_type:complete
MGKTNANKVLGTFRNNYENRKKSMMKSYMEGGSTEEVCSGWPPNCFKKFKSKGKRSTYNPLDNKKGLNIGGNGKLKKAFKKFGRKVKRALS